MKKIYLLATALAALVGCTSEDFTGDQNLREANGSGPISFGFDVPTPTRASGSEAATALDNQFIVWGEKGEAASGAAYTADDPTPNTHQLVFKNYVVEYSSNTAYTTTSNTKDWEYVGKTQGYSTNVVPQAGETQTIKYWDYSATNYVFTAFSAKQTDLSSGKVTVTKVTEKTTGNTVYDKGYTVTLDADADPTKLFFSDRQVVSQGTGTDRTATNAYGGNVTLTFRNLTSQVRVAMYETIPGYTVELDKFYYKDAASPTFAAMTTEGTDKFYANVPNLTTDKAAGFTVTYYNEGTRQNQPKVAITSGTANNYLALGTNLKATTTLGADNVGNATYDKSDKSYTSVFPQESNSTNLKLKVDYILKNATTGETIKVTGATAEVPAEYLMWKPNFKYTYIFKISDNTNGSTGGSVVGLYPITFDAIEIVAEDGQAEYITTVSEPSITTFGVIMDNTPKFKNYVTEKDEYQIPGGTDKLDIYATFMEGSDDKAPTVGGTGAQHVHVFFVTTSDATNFPITEASVAEAIANPAKITNPVYTYDGTSTYTEVTNASDLTAGTTYYKADANSVAPGGSGYVQTVAVEGTDYQIAPKITATDITSDATTYFTTTAPAAVTTVPGEDGVNKDINALKLTGVKTAGTYAIEYEASAAWTGSYKKVYKVIVVQ